MIRHLKAAMLALGAFALALPATILPTAPAAAQQNRAKGGAKAQGAKARPAPAARPQTMPASRPSAGASRDYKKPAGSPQFKAPTSTYSKNNISNKQAYNAGKKAGQYGNQRDVVVVNPPHGGGYYNNGRYYNSDWDDDDDDFLEFVGKTAAVTAGVSAVTAVIGSVVNKKPDGTGCQESIQNGVPYVNCNGTWYQAVPNSTNYQVVAPPTR